MPGGRWLASKPGLTEMTAGEVVSERIMEAGIRAMKTITLPE
jgi:hypothetical protein